MAHAWSTLPRLRPHRPSGLRRAVRAPVLGRPRRAPRARRGVRRPDRPRRARRRRTRDFGSGRLGRHRDRRRRRRRHRRDAARTAARAARPRGHARRPPRHRRPRDGPFETVGQSFFDPLPAGADLYLLKSVLNDWPDAETDAILAQRGALQHERAGVVIGGVAPDDAPRRLGHRDGPARRPHGHAGRVPRPRRPRRPRGRRGPSAARDSSSNCEAMAYDERLAERVREIIHVRPTWSRRRCSAASAG